MLKFFVSLLLLQFTASLGFQIQPKIVNDKESSENEFPFFVDILSPLDKCSGTLISDK